MNNKDQNKKGEVQNAKTTEPKAPSVEKVKQLQSVLKDYIDSMVMISSAKATAENYKKLRTLGIHCFNATKAGDAAIDTQIATLKDMVAKNTASLPDLQKASKDAVDAYTKALTEGGEIPKERGKGILTPEGDRNRKAAAFAKALSTRGFTVEGNVYKKADAEIRFDATTWTMLKNGKEVHSQPFAGGSIDIVDKQLKTGTDNA